MPMQAILHTNNDIKTAIEKKKSSLYGNVGNAEQRLILQNVLRMGFDDILTTNYSYELEIAALGLSSVKESQAYCRRGANSNARCFLGKDHRSAHYPK